MSDQPRVSPTSRPKSAGIGSIVPTIQNGDGWLARQMITQQDLQSFNQTPDKISWSYKPPAWYQYSGNETPLVYG